MIDILLFDHPVKPGRLLLATLVLFAPPCCMSVWQIAWTDADLLEAGSVYGNNKLNGLTHGPSLDQCAPKALAQNLSTQGLQYPECPCYVLSWNADGTLKIPCRWLADPQWNR